MSSQYERPYLVLVLFPLHKQIYSRTAELKMKDLPEQPVHHSV